MVDNDDNEKENKELISNNLFSFLLFRFFPLLLLLILFLVGLEYNNIETTVVVDSILVLVSLLMDTLMKIECVSYCVIIIDIDTIVSVGIIVCSRQSIRL